jgi:hypothetical protein
MTHITKRANPYWMIRRNDAALAGEILRVTEMREAA